MFEALAKTLAAAFSIWEFKEKHKYIEKLNALRRKYYEESNKPYEDRSDAILDNLRFELRLLSDAFSSNVGESNASNKP